MNIKSLYIFYFIILIFSGCSITKNKNLDKPETYRYPAFSPQEYPNIQSTDYPKGDGLTYSVYLGETFSGYKLANGWRFDTINGSVNSTIKNPYLKITDTLFEKTHPRYSKESKEKNISSKSGQYHFYIYKEGKLFNGLLNDTVETENGKELIFEGFAKEGLIQGNCKFSFKTDSSIACQGKIKDGEMIGKWYYYNYYSNDSTLVEERTYAKNIAYPIKIIKYKTKKQ